MEIALVQYSPTWETPKKTIETINSLIVNTDLEKTTLLVFPELSLTGFTMNSSKFAEEIDGVSTLYFMQLARKIKKHIFAGIIEKDGEQYFNSLVHFDNKGLIQTRYRKIHPFTPSGESDNYVAGNEICVTKIDGVTFGLSICYDLRFPELYRKYTLKNIDILVNIANWPETRIEHWDTLLKSRAIENQAFVIGVNRVGEDPKYKYPGHSSVISPMGKRLGQSFAEEISIIKIEIDEVKSTREALPFLDDIKLIK